MTLIIRESPQAAAGDREWDGLRQSCLKTLVFRPRRSPSLIPAFGAGAAEPTFRWRGRAFASIDVFTAGTGEDRRSTLAAPA